MLKGCRLTVSALPDEARQRAWLESLERGHTDGVILVVAELSQVHRQRLEKLRVPVVIVDPMADPPPNVPSIGVTNWIGGMRATEHLIALGHVRIGMVAGNTRQLFYRSRLDGYRAALEHAGLAGRSPPRRGRDLRLSGGLRGGESHAAVAVTRRRRFLRAPTFTRWASTRRRA